MTTPQLYACLRYKDADAAIAFVTALGLTERLVVRDEKDPSFVHHAQFRWRDNGGVMFGSDRDGGVGPDTAAACTNLVVATDEEVDQVLAAALDAGGEQLGELQEPPHGGRSVAVTDPEGNIWHIDSYPGE